MRDLLLTAIIFGAIPFILRRPWIGIMMWVWVSLMSPHRLTFGFAYDMQFAQVVALATILAILFSKEKFQFPWCGITITLVAMSAWMSFTTLFAIEPAWAIPQWEKVMKIQIMNLVCLYVLSSRQHIEVMSIVTMASIAFYGVKGGIFTLTGGGAERVYGPSGSFIEENNALGLATIMTIPLVYYWSLHVRKRLWKWGLVGVAILCGFSALGSHSRGGLLAIAAMAVFLWIKSKHKFATLVVLAALAPTMIAFMPDKWVDRMESISDYEEDGSAQGRLNAWMLAINLVKDRPLVGGGFNFYSEYTYGRWAPNPHGLAHSSHSNYFQMLGEHGYPGLFLFLLLLLLAWRTASWIIRMSKAHPNVVWAADLSRAIQVSLVGYSVGGAFLNLGYFDLPYFLMTMLVLMRVWVARELGLDATGRLRNAVRGSQLAREGS